MTGCSTRRTSAAGSARQTATSVEIAREFARYLVASRLESVPQPVRHEAARSVLNWAGCAVGGSRHEAIDRALATISRIGGPPQASVLGRAERTDIAHAALVNGMSAHVLDFDDTHLRTLLHPSVPVAPALLALAERQLMTGADFLHAFILGVEVECRIANAIYAGHNTDWYITGTAGVCGAAAAAGKAMGLGEPELAAAIGLACAQSAGTREHAGTMTKCFVHGRAAQNGLVAALLAREGFTSAALALEGEHGLFKVMTPRADLSRIVAGLGETFALALNTYKPYACGVVAHPAIEACMRLRAEHGVRAGEVEAIELTVHPKALLLAGIESPASGLKSKWSLHHSAAVALVDGAAGEQQYSDARVHDPVIAALRQRVAARADARLTEVEAHATCRLRDGRVVTHHVEKVIGSSERPMSDRDLEVKVVGLCEGILPPHRTRALIETCWDLPALADAAAIPRAAVPL
jgi:2-methylcitrate dehydratase PrpD